MLVFAPPGAVPVVGGSLDTSVQRSPGVFPRNRRAAHGPRHPAVRRPLRIGRYLHMGLCRDFKELCWFLCAVFFFGEGILFGIVPFKT